MKNEREITIREVKEIKRVNNEKLFSYATLAIGSRVCASCLFDKAAELGRVPMATASLISGIAIMLSTGGWMLAFTDKITDTYKTLKLTKKTK